MFVGLNPNSQWGKSGTCCTSVPRARLEARDCVRNARNHFEHFSASARRWHASRMGPEKKTAADPRPKSRTRVPPDGTRGARKSAWVEQFPAHGELGRVARGPQ
jgi:hypothetical protein